MSFRPPHPDARGHVAHLAPVDGYIVQISLFVWVVFQIIQFALITGRQVQLESVWRDRAAPRQDSTVSTPKA